MKDARVWLRLGDNSDYESFDSPFDAGFTIGGVLSVVGAPVVDTKEVRYRPMGIEVGGFAENNYISLFWGDDDARPVNEANLNESDKLDLLAGIEEGMN